MVLVLRGPSNLDLGDLDISRVTFRHGFKPEADRWIARGAPAWAEQPVSAAVVSVSRVRALTLGLIHQAAAVVPDGAPIIVDGNKTDGVESILKACRKCFDVGEVFSKSHGKCFAFPAPEAAPDEWRLAKQNAEGFTTYPGVFSSDGVDPGSRLLAAHLDGLAGRVCDLGAGWGYLSAQALHDDVTGLDLVEAEAMAVACARLNVADPRAAFHWADATRWTGGPYDWVICNPPFHAGRKGDPGLGQAFIATAARVLTPQGRLRMVANRHLPYESTLAARFAEIRALQEDGGYKVIEARKPLGAARGASR